MKLPRDISGAELASALCRRWQYRQVHQVGSHIVLDTATPSAHRVSIPAHSPLRLGTLNAILRAVAAHKRTTREAILDTL